MGKFKQVLNYAEKAFKTLYEKQGYRPEDLAQITEYKGLINKTAEILSEQIPYETPAEMRQYLEQDVFVFSGLKTHAQLTEAHSYLKDEKGNLRAYHDFEQKVLKLNEKYNRHYLEAEYEFAAHSAISASQWANLENDTERYWLEYRTAGDERVRASHDALRGVCLPKTDPFWDSFYPPNGWRCRCVAVEVLAREKTLTDSQKAQEMGEKATTQIGKNGKNKLAMFRFNAGKEKKIFPPKNSYTKVVGADKVKKVIEEESLEQDYKILKENSSFKTMLSRLPIHFLNTYPEIDIEKKGCAIYYSGSGYKALNSYLRGFEKDIYRKVIDKKFNASFAKVLNKTLEEIPDRFSGTAYRGTRLSQEQILNIKTLFENGENYIDNGFMSSTYSKREIFSGNVNFKIKVKDAAKIEKLSKFETEKEVLFKAGQPFKIKNIKYNEKSEKYEVELEQL